MSTITTIIPAHKSSLGTPMPITIFKKNAHGHYELVPDVETDYEKLKKTVYLFCLLMFRANNYQQGIEKTKLHIGLWWAECIMLMCTGKQICYETYMRTNNGIISEKMEGILSALIDEGKIQITVVNNVEFFTPIL